VVKLEASLQTARHCRFARYLFALYSRNAAAREFAAAR